MDTENKIAEEVEQLKEQQALIVRSVRISLSLILLTLAATYPSRASHSYYGERSS